jgi:hypothetical protein
MINPQTLVNTIGALLLIGLFAWLMWERRS